MIRLWDTTDPPQEPERLYENLRFPAPPPDRPYIFMNTVITLDGKTVLGERGSTAKGLGSPTDQRLMRLIELASDCVIIGGGTLRADPHLHYPEKIYRAVVTTSGELPVEHPFFAVPDKALIFAPADLPREKQLLLARVGRLHQVGETQVEIAQMVQVLHAEYGVSYLLVEGGGNLNFYFFEAGLVDEIFLTLAPKVKGGAHLPTMVEGPGLPREQVAHLELLSAYLEGNELFLRYRVVPPPQRTA